LHELWCYRPEVAKSDGLISQMANLCPDDGSREYKLAKDGGK